MIDPSVIDAAQRTLDEIAIAALATTSPDGHPWNAPVYVAFDRRAFYWSSRRDAQHSRNIESNGVVMLVVFDSITPDASGHAVYVRAKARELTDETSIRRALDALALRKGRPLGPATDFMAAHPSRVYEAVPEQFWTNVLRHQAGHYFDERVTIDLKMSRER